MTREMTKDDWAASDVLVDAFEAVAAGVDHGTICATLGRLTWMYADDHGKDLFRLLMRGDDIDDVLKRLDEETDDGN